MPPVTASQTIGPFWHLLGESGNNDLTRFGATGPRMLAATLPHVDAVEHLVRRVRQHAGGFR